MSRKKTASDRMKRRLRSAKKKEDAIREYVEAYNIHPRVAAKMPPSEIMRILSKRKRNLLRAAEEASSFKKTLEEAKLLSIVADDFEYGNVAASSESSLVEYKERLTEAMKQVEGEDMPAGILDDIARTVLQAALNEGVLVPTKAKAGSVPKVRKMKSGKVVVMQRGEMDYEYILEKFGIK